MDNNHWNWDRLLLGCWLANSRTTGLHVEELAGPDALLLNPLLSCGASYLDSDGESEVVGGQGKQTPNDQAYNCLIHFYKRL